MSFTQLQNSVANVVFFSENRWKAFPSASKTWILLRKKSWWYFWHLGLRSASNQKFKTCVQKRSCQWRFISCDSKNKAWAWNDIEEKGDEKIHKFQKKLIKILVISVPLDASVGWSPIGSSSASGVVPVMGWNHPWRATTGFIPASISPAVDLHTAPPPRLSSTAREVASSLLRLYQTENLEREIWIFLSMKILKKNKIFF